MGLTAERAAWVTLALTPGIGAARMTTLLTHCGSPAGALSAPAAFLGTLPGISRAAATAITQASPESGTAALLATERLGGHCLIPSDPEFPAALREIPDPPILLFLLGRMDLLQLPALAVVGSRDHSDYGATVARQVAGTAARAGLAVVSGMARGLDAVAHLAALDAGGATIGVLGNGLGVIYPAANRALYERASRDGLLLTEFPPGERPAVGFFPRRNRLISGLARATVVVEAAVGSGALITVECALNQGREVLAVPGNITSPTSAGANRLIRDGATPWLGVEDLAACYPDIPTDRWPPLADERREGSLLLGPLSPGTAPGRKTTPRGASPPAPAAPAAPPPDLPEAEQTVYRALSAGPLPLDDLIVQAGLAPAAVLAAVGGLELAGLAGHAGGRVKLL